VAVTLSVAVAPRATPAPTPRVETVDVSRVYQPREVDQAPKKVSGDYPDPTGLPKLKSGERVSVSVVFVVTEAGEVTDVEVIESGGSERLNEAVMKAVKKWRFEPGVKAGTKVRVRQSQKFTYQVG
jgi:protein TonB